jgi:hypothetical protein
VEGAPVPGISYSGSVVVARFDDNRESVPLERRKEKDIGGAYEKSDDKRMKQTPFASGQNTQGYAPSSRSVHLSQTILPRLPAGAASAGKDIKVTLTRLTEPIRAVPAF